MGFYVMGKYQSVAWCKTREEAEKIARQGNYYGGINWTVVADYTTKALAQILPVEAKNAVKL